MKLKGSAKETIINVKTRLQDERKSLPTNHKIGTCYLEYRGKTVKANHQQ